MFLLVHLVLVKQFIFAEDITSASDRTFKINIQTLKHSLDRVKRLRGVTFEWDRKNFPKFSSGTQLGLIAQEVKEVLPEVVHGGENGNTLSLAYDKIVAILIESIKELDEKVDNNHNYLLNLIKNKK